MSFPYKIRQCFVQFHDSICAMCFLRQQTNVHMRKRFPEWVHCQVNIAFFTGCKKIKQRRISFVLGYLRMILWKISTAISIKHRILATINIEKKSILAAYMPLERCRRHLETTSTTGEAFRMPLTFSCQRTIALAGKPAARLPRGWNMIFISQNMIFVLCDHVFWFLPIVQSN